MKHTRIFTSVLLAVAILFSVALAQSAGSFPFSASANARVSLYGSASTSSSVLDTIWEGDTLTVTSESGNYYKVKYGSKTGYVVKKYVGNSSSSVQEVAVSDDETAAGYPYTTHTTDSVNLREKSSTSSKKLCSIPAGTEITVESVSGSFAKVKYNGQSGYVVKDYINVKKIVKPTATPKPIPTLSPEEQASGYKLLQSGTSGDDVVSLQQALAELGYFSGKIDGIFGTATNKAVVNFQAKNKYPSTGLVDANLQAFLYSGEPLNSKGKKTSVSTLSPVSDVAITLNKKGNLVGKVQTRLQELGFYSGTVSNTYDKATKAAVTNFQKKNGLKSDGICTIDVRNKLFGPYVVSAFGNVITVATEAPEESIPTLSPNFTVPSTKVERGSKGNDAKLVQQRLADLGYLSGKIDGIFGTDSVSALKNFQNKNGLKSDGVAGTSTYNVLFSSAAVSSSGSTVGTVTAPQNIVTAVPATMAPVTRENVVVVKEGVSGESVRFLQKRLTELGYYTSNADGICKADDTAAIKLFQKRNNLKVDGAAGYDTQVLLYSNAALTYSGAIAGNALSSFTTLRKGMKGEDVRAMQQRLLTLGYLSGTADGIYGTKTAEAVVNFQRANGLTRDGVAGNATLSMLYSQIAVSGQSSAPSPTVAPVTNTTLRKGDKSDAVRNMQQHLIDLGYLSGKADGIFGVNTYRALIEFQSKNLLTKDGIAGINTLAMLNSGNAVAAAGNTVSNQQQTPATSSPVVNEATVKASDVQYVYWYDELRNRARQYPYATVYDFSTGISWQVHMFSLGAHADSEPLTASDTAKMEKAFGGNTWNPKAVWVIFGDGSVYMASTHSMPHEVEHITTNNFPGHLCIHFPRTQSQVTAIGPYATSHQKALDVGWALTQSMK